MEEVQAESPSLVPLSSEQPAQPYRAALWDLISFLKEVPQDNLARSSDEQEIVIVTPGWAKLRVWPEKKQPERTGGLIIMRTIHAVPTPRRHGVRPCNVENPF